jgi:endonuclease-3 related protein
MLYVYDRPVFIWDSYARRVLAAAGYAVANGYESARRALTEPMLAAEFTTLEQQRFHGLIVEAGKLATAAGGWDTYWHQLHD